MRAGRRAAAVVVGAALTLLAVTWGPASAADVKPVDRQAWARTGAVATFVAEANRLYSAVDLGVEQARTYFRVDAAVLPDTGAVLVLTEATGSALPEQAVLLGCPLTSPLTKEGELSAEAAPDANCSAGVTATRTATGIWSIPLDTLGKSWRSGKAYGLAVVPKVTDAATFRVSFDPAKTAITGPKVTVVPPPAPTASPSASTPPTAEEPSNVDTGTAELPSTGDGLLGGEVSPPTLGGAPTSVPPVGADPDTAGPTRVPTTNAGQSAGLPLSANSPSTLLVLALVALLAAGPAMALGRRRSSDGAAVLPPSSYGPGVRWIGMGVAAAAFIVLPSLLGEVTVYKFGLILVLLVGAIGLHLLVNWVGELSLAHATIIGFPAFVVAGLCSTFDMSPIYLLPVGILAGAVIGGVVGLPAIRARGLQVALVTLAAGVAIDRFFFTREWFVGPPTGSAVPVPSFAGLTFRTARSLYPVLAVLVLVAIVVAWMLYRSTIVRGMLWVKADPAAAAAFGVPVARYRALAYVLAGGFAGFSGGLTAMWVQTVTAQSFPPTRSFSYLIIVALAGRGFLGGVAVAAVMVEGGRLFLANGDAFMTYAAPLGLILTLTTYRGGLNGLAGTVRARLSRREGTMSSPTPTLGSSTNGGWRPLTVVGVLACALGFAAIALAWYHAGNTSQLWVQNQEMISGGLGGLALVVLGVGLVVYDRASVEREVTAERWERLIEALENQPPPVHADGSVT